MSCWSSHECDFYVTFPGRKTACKPPVHRSFKIFLVACPNGHNVAPESGYSDAKKSIGGHNSLWLDLDARVVLREMGLVCGGVHVPEWNDCVNIQETR